MLLINLQDESTKFNNLFRVIVCLCNINMRDPCHFDWRQSHCLMLHQSSSLLRYFRVMMSLLSGFILLSGTCNLTPPSPRLLQWAAKPIRISILDISTLMSYRTKSKWKDVHKMGDFMHMKHDHVGLIKLSPSVESCWFTLIFSQCCLCLNCTSMAVLGRNRKI